MEPRDRAGATLTDEGRATFRLRLLAACVLLAGLAFVQSPGLLVSDTKFDLVADPGGFLGRALSLWDPEGTFGQVQNQAYGYLWPMGPFFWLGDALGLPGWTVQRLWWVLVLCTAFVGTALLLRALGVRSDLAALVGGAAFALSPRMLTVIGPSSIEVWPSALAPWVLLALVVGSRRGSPRRAAAWAGLGVAMVGGVNAAATFAVIPLGAVWLLTRERGPRRTALLVWWPVFTLLGTLWWLVPLFLMGAYSPPFLDFIETSSVTTFPATVFDTLRGTSNWVPYVDARSRAGNDLVVTSYLALNSGVVLLLGAAGLLHRRTPHRPFLALGLLLGVLMVAAGHLGAVSGWLSGDVAAALDGALAPLRNVHKFDPVVRLPLVVGLAFLLDHAVGARASAERSGLFLERGVLLVTTVAVVAGAATPALLGRLAPADETLAVPTYWQETARFLAAEDGAAADAPDDGGGGGGVALLAPGSGFADYQWGSTRDEPLQFEADSRWAVRNVIPLTPPATIRMLDGAEQRLAQGLGGAGLTAYFQRAGVRHLVVRNDLVPDGDLPSAALVHQALDGSPGIERVATFGPRTGGEAFVEDDGRRLVLEGGWRDAYDAVEVYEVQDVATQVAAGTPDVVVGGPEDLVDLLDLGVVDDRPTVLGVDVPDEDLAGSFEDARVVLSDGLRARERAFARIHDATSPVLTGDEPRRTGNPARDYLLDTDDRWSTTARYVGAADVSASSSASDAGAFGGSRRGEQPYAALDGSPDTSWTAGAAGSGRASWRLDLDEPLRLPRQVTLVGGDRAAEEQVVRLVWAGGRSEELALGPGESVEVDVLRQDEEVRWLQVEDASPAGEQDISLAEVEVPGVEVERWLDLPRLPEGWGAPDAVVLRADRDARDGCAEVGLAVRCAATLEVPDEEATAVRRTFGLPEQADYGMAVTVRPRGGDALTGLLDDGSQITPRASSLAVSDPRASAPAAVDGRSGTTWTADPDDPRPTLDLTWLGERTLTAVEVELDEGAAARAPTRVTLVWPGGRRTVDLEDGRADLDGAIVTDQLAIEVDRAETDVAAPGAGEDEASVGISELRLTGAPDRFRDRLNGTVLACGSGPLLQVGDVAVPTAVRIEGAVLDGGTLQALPCPFGNVSSGDPDDPDAPFLRLERGDTDVTVTDNPAFALDALVLTRVDGQEVSGAAPTPAGALDPATSTRSVPVGPDDAVAVVRENANPGWRATQDGASLEPVVLDGWQQGWLLDGDATGPVEVAFAPAGTYRAGLLVGLGAVLLLLAATVGAGVVRRVRRRPAAASEDPPAVGDGRPPAAVVGVGVLVGLGVVSGTTGLLVALVAGGLVVLVGRRWPGSAEDVVPWLFALPLFVAAAAYALQPWGSANGWAGTAAWPQYLAVATLAAIVLRGVLLPGPPEAADPAGAQVTDTGGDGTVGEERRAKRWAGASTQR